MAWWNRNRTEKAANINYGEVMAAFNKYLTGQPAWIPQNDKNYIEQAYFENDHVFSIIRLLTRAASTLPVYLYRVVDKKAYRRFKNLQMSENPDILKLIGLKRKALEQVEKHVILDTLERPNPEQAWPEFVENVFGYKYLLGNTYMFGVGPDGGDNAGTFKEIYVLPSQHMEIKMGTKIEPIESYLLDQNGVKLPIPKEQICHLKSWSPDYASAGSHMYGVSPIRAGMKKIKIGNDGSTTMVKMLQNMGMFGMFVLKDKNLELDPAKAKEFERLFYQKQRHKGRAMFMGADFKWENAGMSPVDLAILESNKMSLRDTCNLWSLSSQLLNDPDNKTYNNMKEARKAMWTNAILPDYNAFVGELNRWLVAPFNKKSGDIMVLDYDIQAIPELQEDMEKLVAYVKDMYWATIDEQRDMTNLDQSKGGIGEKHPIPSSIILTDSDGEVPAVEPTPEQIESAKVAAAALKQHIENGQY